MWRRFFLVVLIVLIARKLYLGHVAMNYVWDCRTQVSHQTMSTSDAFARAISSLDSDSEKASLIMILNQHALNMTLNWLCNTHLMTGVHNNLLIVTLDLESDRELELLWPGLRRLRWEAPCLEEPFNYGDGRYQLFYLFRANLALTLLRMGKQFWMIQQDTFWRDNLLNADVLRNFTADILFDRADDDPAGRLIAGGYYFARPTPGSIRYFERLSGELETLYVPDNTYMTALCEEPGVATCDHAPFGVITNWMWLHEPNRRAKAPPVLIQFDGDTRLGGKILTMQQMGFYFLNSTTPTPSNDCNTTAVETARLRISQPNYLRSGAIEPTTESGGLLGPKRWSHWQFGIYQWLIDVLNRSTLTKNLLYSVVFPYAHYFMITL